jgi:lipopolysaccharide export LptBFGC system permease protein LptF
MNDITFMILKIVLAIAVAIITRYLVPWLKAQNNSSTRTLIYELVETGVKAAEQTITGDGRGSEKKKAVELYVLEQLDNLGITMTVDQIDEIIEEFVYAINNPS